MDINLWICGRCNWQKQRQLLLVGGVFCMHSGMHNQYTAAAAISPPFLPTQAEHPATGCASWKLGDGQYQLQYHPTCPVQQESGERQRPLIAPMTQTHRLCTPSSSLHASMMSNTGVKYQSNKVKGTGTTGNKMHHSNQPSSCINATICQQTQQKWMGMHVYIHIRRPFLCILAV